LADNTLATGAPTPMKIRVNRGWKKFLRDRWLLLMMVPGIIYYVVFKFLPMYGVIIAFKKFNVYLGILKSPWVGFKHFVNFFNAPYFWQLIRNTMLINIYSLVFTFPMPIILAIAFNEIYRARLKKPLQSITFLPHFISTVVVTSLVLRFLAPTSGIVNKLLGYIGVEPVSFLTDPKYFRSIYIIMEVWKGVGWSSILFIAALSRIDTALYEAAVVDGSSKLQQQWYITLPSIIPTIVIMLILRVGHLLDLGAQTIILLYNPMIYETADVLSTFVYRRGIVNADFSYAAAVDLFTSVIGFVLIISSNKISKMVTDSGLW